ncbi:MAG: GNAT family N-acetyltransferase [Actinomycetia bacterium]|nr:GNAT family N-acetyltransferase [Actinomycetes bacterium]
MITPRIRTADARDLDALYDVCLRTGDAGNDGAHLFDDPRLLGEIYVGPYVMLSSAFAYAAVDEGKPSGYVLGTLDTRLFEAECETAWWPDLRSRHVDPASNPATPDDELIAEIYRPQLASDAVVKRFPANFHIDLLPAIQGKGIGSLMMDQLFSVLRAGDSPGVHMDVATRNDRAVGFYEHLGFSVVESHNDSVIMGKRLNTL